MFKMVTSVYFTVWMTICGIFFYGCDKYEKRFGMDISHIISFVLLALTAVIVCGLSVEDSHVVHLAYSVAMIIDIVSAIFFILKNINRIWLMVIFAITTITVLIISLGASKAALVFMSVIAVVSVFFGAAMNE